MQGNSKNSIHKIFVGQSRSYKIWFGVLLMAIFGIFYFSPAYANKLNEKFLSCKFWVNTTPGEVQQMIRWGADVNAVSSDGLNNVLFVASYCSLNTKVVKVLLNNGADIKWTNNQNQNVAMATISSGNLTMLKFLHKNGVDFKYVGDRGCGVLWMALVIEIQNSKELITYLLKVTNKNINDRICFKGTLLNIAAKYNNPDVVQEIIELGADVNMRNPSVLHKIGLFTGSKPLYLARNRPDFKGTKALELLEEKTNITWYDKFLEKMMSN